MFKIYDGRESFYQWDIDRKLIVDDDSITQVHFCNRTDECSLVCETYTENGLNVVNVPNILLQDDWRINVYAYDHNYTKHSTQYDVIRRSKPDSYVYTETETLNYNTLLNRVNEVDANIAQNVENYLKENPVEVDLTGYATEKYVDDAIANIDVPDVDLSDYYTKSEVDNLIPSTSGLATIGYVNEKFNSIVIPDTTGFVDEERVLELIEEHGGGNLPASEEGEF